MIKYTRVEHANILKEYQIKHYLSEPTDNIVQAFINNISFPKSLEELDYFIFEHGSFNVENILFESETNWTAPKWAKIGDIVFFMHSKTARSTITALRTELFKLQPYLPQEIFDIRLEWLNRALQLHNLYGGKIFAIGKVTGAPEYISDEDDDPNFFHWGSRIYADMEVYVLENPIHISEFNDFIYVSRQGAITPVFGKEFIQLKKLIMSKNITPYYFEESIATPLPLTKINHVNWIEITEEYRRSFMLESQFRSYYVDYLLESIGDRKTIYKECRCVKGNNPNTFTDNVIYIKGRYLPIEVKLSIAVESDIKDQVNQYCNTDEIYIDSKKGRKVIPNQIYNNNVLVIDTEDVYMFDSRKYNLFHVQSLNQLKTKDDVKKLKDIIINHLSY